jgi:hypothetical protein
MSEKEKAQEMIAKYGDKAADVVDEIIFSFPKWLIVNQMAIEYWLEIKKQIQKQCGKTSKSDAPPSQK